MKAKYVFLYIAGIICFLTSCEKSDKDNISQKWQLNTITSKNEVEKSGCDSIFFNFQNEMFQFQRLQETGKVYSVFGFFEIKGDSVHIQYIRPSNGFNYDLLLWEDMEKSFHIKHLSGRKLELEDDEVTYKFRSF